jgi:hypothetical protein
LEITQDGWAIVAQDRIKWNWIMKNVTRSDQTSASTNASVMADSVGGNDTQISVVIFDTAINNAASTVTVGSESSTLDTLLVPDLQSTQPLPSIMIMPSTSPSASPATQPPSSLSSSSPATPQRPCLHASPPRSHHLAEPV